MNKTPLLVILALLLPLSAGAFDYKAWPSLLPPTLGNLKPSGEPNGMNMDAGGQGWSTLEQAYSSQNGDKTATITIMAGEMAVAQGVQAMETMNIETGDQIIKTLDIDGAKCILMLDKAAKNASLMIQAQPQLTINLTLEPADNETEILSLAKKLPIAKFAKLK
jgi:hypothetical protein